MAALRRVVGSAFDGHSTVFTAPLGVGGAIGMAAGGAVGAAAAAGCACVHLLTVGVSAVLVRAAGTALRFADSAVLRVKNIRMSCPSCGERVPYPGYECPDGPRCTRRHRDIRPGRLGILRRRCQCGKPLPTLLLFGSAGMNAFCPRCGASLEHQPGKAPETVLPLFGAVGAGKTRLLFALVTQLQLWSQGKQEPRFTVEFADAATASKLEHAGELLSPKSVTAKTPVELPRAYLIRLVTGSSTRMLQMFDPAGELLLHRRADRAAPVSQPGAHVHPGHRSAGSPGVLGPTPCGPEGRTGRDPGLPPRCPSRLPGRPAADRGDAGTAAPGHGWRSCSAGPT